MQSNSLIKMRPVLTLSGCFRSKINTRSISKSESVQKNRRQNQVHEDRNRPFAFEDTKKDDMTAKSLHWKEKEGSQLLKKALSKHIVHPPGKISKSTKEFKVIPEMIPEFIVPDLTGFELKPYVSYASEPIQEEKLTARKLFNFCYADKIKEIEAKKAIENKSQDTPSQIEDPKVT